MELRTLAMKNPTISIIFPTLNSKKLLPAFFQSLSAQSYPKSQIDVRIVDNGSSDGTAEFIKERFPKVKLIQLKKNIGFAPALNLLAKDVKSDLIFITNDDVTFSENCLEDLVKLLISNPKIGMVGGKLLSSKGNSAWPGFKLNPYLGYMYHDLTNLDKVRESDWLTGPCIMIKTKVMRKVGFFDPGYFFCGEDFDLSIAVRKAGFKIMYAPSAKIYHKFRRSGNLKFSSIFAHYRGKFRLIIKNATPLQILTSLPFQLLAVPLYRLLTKPSVFPIIFATTYLGFAWNLIHLPETLRARKK